MGMQQSLCGVTRNPRLAIRGRRTGFAFMVTALALSALAGCSSLSSPSSSASANPPNPYQTAAAVPPASADENDYSPYPKQSLVDFFRGSTESPPPAQSVPRPPAAYTPSGQPYVAGQPAYAAPAPASADEGDYSPYPKQSLVDFFKGSADSPRPAQNAPRPPASYTPSAQPYTPSAQTYPPSQPANGAAAPATVPSAPVASAYPQQSLFDIFKRDPGAQ
jgi:hypothetical protein